jgi:hypothetical protein
MHGRQNLWAVGPSLRTFYSLSIPIILTVYTIFVMSHKEYYLGYQKRYYKRNRDELLRRYQED